MSGGFDEWAEWLDLQNHSTTPTYYELLAISPKEADSKSIEQAARRQLSKLNSIDPGSQEPKLESLKSEIKKAFAVLKDPAKRSAYDQSLQRAPKRIQTSDTDMLPPSKASKPKSKKTSAAKQSASAVQPQDRMPPTKVAKSDLLPPTKKKSTATNPDSAPKTRAIPKAALPPQAATRSTDSNPPQAIPTAASVPPTATPAVANQPPIANPVPPAHQPSQQAPAHDVKILSQNIPSGNRRWIVPLIVIVTSVSLVSGCVILMKQLKLGDVLASARKNEDSDQEPIDPSSQANTKPETNPDNSKTDPEKTQPPTKPPKDPETNSQDVTPTDPVDIDQSDVDANTPPGDPIQPTDPSQIRMTGQEVFQKVFEEKYSVQAALKHQMLHLKNQWLRQKFESLPETPLVQESAYSPEAIAELNTGVQQTSRRLQEFWQQFKTSSLEHEGNIEVDGRIAGFVEATQSHLILKIAGSVRHYEYRFVPPGLMMEIIDRGRIEDIPTYRLQKAAYLISCLNRRPDFENEIFDLLNQSADDGHDVHYLMLAAKFKYWRLAEPVSRPPFAADNKPLSVVDSIQTYEKITDIPIDRAGELAHVAIAQSYDFDEELEAEEKQSRRLETLDVARQLAARNGDILMAMDLVHEIQQNAGRIRGPIELDTFTLTAKSAATDPDKANWFCETVLAYLRENGQGLKKNNVNRIGNVALKMAEQHNLRAVGLQLQSKLKSL